MTNKMSIDKRYAFNIEKNCQDTIYDLNAGIGKLNKVLDKLSEYNGSHSIAKCVSKIELHKDTLSSDKNALEKLIEDYKIYKDDMIGADKACYEYIKKNFYDRDKYSIIFNDETRSFHMINLKTGSIDNLESIGSEEDIKAVTAALNAYFKEIVDVSLDEETYALALWLKNSGYINKVEDMARNYGGGLEALTRDTGIDWKDIFDPESNKIKSISKFLSVLSVVEGIGEGYNKSMEDGNNPLASAAVHGASSLLATGFTIQLTVTGAQIGSALGPVGTLVGGGIGLVGGLIIDTGVSEIVEGAGDWLLDTFFPSTVYDNNYVNHSVTNIGKRPEFQDINNYYTYNNVPYVNANM